MATAIVPMWEMLRQACEQPDFDKFDIPAQSMNAFCLAMGRYVVTDAHGLWMDPDDNDGHSADNLILDIGCRMSEFAYAHNGPGPESPIEGMLLGALLWLRVEFAGLPSLWDFGLDELSCRTLDPGQTGFWILPQETVGKHRVDFLLWIQQDDRGAGLIVECDGHEFHEKTKEQAARDKKRDRELLAAGFPVMRFTGSEIYRDPVGCVEQVHAPALKCLEQVVAGGYRGRA